MKNLGPTADGRSQLGISTTQQSSSTLSDSIDTDEVRLDIKKFAQLLHSQQPHAEKMVFSNIKIYNFSRSLIFI
jgi:hypothetical protein